jgi:hypothetical protein
MLMDSRDSGAGLLRMNIFFMRIPSLLHMIFQTRFVDNLVLFNRTP